MYRPFTFFLISTAIATAQLPVGYEWLHTASEATPVKAEDAVPLAKAYRWSAGLSARRVSASFQALPPAQSWLQPYLLQDKVDPGAYRGSGTVVYDNGTIGSGSDVNWDGTAYSGGALTSDARRYSSELLAYTRSGSAESLDAAASDRGLGAYVRLEGVLAETDSVRLGLSATLSFNAADWDTGAVPTSRVRVMQQSSRVNYDYQRLSLIVIGPFPVIIPTPSFDKNNPRRSVSNGQRSVAADWRGTSQLELHARSYELLLSADTTWQLGQRWAATLALGPTLNLVNTELELQQRWRDGVSGRSLLMVESESSNHFRLGVGAQLGLSYALSPASWLELRGGYRWQEPIELSMAGAAAEVDGSSWEIALGVGMQLGHVPAQERMEQQLQETRLGRLVSWLNRPFQRVATVSEKRSEWWFSAGAASGHLNASLLVDAPATSVISGMFPTGMQGRGNVGLFGLGRDRVDYEDGSVGPVWTDVSNPGNNGDAYGTINGVSQLTDTGRNTSGGDDIYRLDYHSSGTQWLHSGGSQSVEAESSDAGWAPLLQMGWSYELQPAWSLGLSAGWQRLEADFDSGLQSVGSYRVQHQRTDYTYSYDISAAAFVGATPASVTYPFFSTQGWIVYDADALATTPTYRQTGFQDPRMSESAHTLQSSHFTAVSQARLSTVLQQVPLLVDLAMRPHPRLECRLSFGPTFNYLQSELTATSQWWQQRAGRDRLIAERTLQVQEDSWKVGAQLSLAARVDLDAKGRWFLEARANCQWLQAGSISGDMARASVSTGQWTAGLSIGYRL